MPHTLALRCLVFRPLVDHLLNRKTPNHPAYEFLVVESGKEFLSARSRATLVQGLTKDVTMTSISANPPPPPPPPVTSANSAAAQRAASQQKAEETKAAEQPSKTEAAYVDFSNQAAATPAPQAQPQAAPEAPPEQSTQATTQRAPTQAQIRDSLIG
jgi:hypothetical protein